MKSLVKKKGENIYNRPTLGKCFRCEQQGHLSNECPQRRALTIEEGQEDDDSDDNVHEVSTSDEGDQLSCVVQRILLTPIVDYIPQRNSLFKIRCTINSKVCQVIIDRGSSENLVSKKLVTVLNLKTEPHPNPYKVSWIKKRGEATVSEVCTVSLSIGQHYKDQLICDVLEWILPYSFRTSLAV